MEPKAHDVYILKQYLPGCPSGRLFHVDFEGNYFVKMTKEEFESNSICPYRFPKEFVINSKDWFKPKLYGNTEVECANYSRVTFKSICGWSGERADLQKKHPLEDEGYCCPKCGSDDIYKAGYNE